jgi:hypothetical protein
MIYPHHKSRLTISGAQPFDKSVVEVAISLPGLGEREAVGLGLAGDVAVKGGGRLSQRPVYLFR